MRQGTFRFNALGVTIATSYPVTLIILKYRSDDFFTFAEDNPGYKVCLSAQSFAALREAVILAEGSADTPTATRVLKVIDRTAKLLADWTAST